MAGRHWLIWGLAALLAGLIIGTVGGIAFTSWALQREDQRYCQLVAAIRVSDTALYHQLAIEGAAADC